LLFTFVLIKIQRDNINVVLEKFNVPCFHSILTVSKGKHAVCQMNEIV